MIHVTCVLGAGIITKAEQIVAFVKEQVRQREAELIGLEEEAARQPPAPAAGTAAHRASPAAVSSGQKQRKRAQSLILCCMPAQWREELGRLPFKLAERCPEA